MPVLPAKCARFPRLLKHSEFLSVRPSHDSNGEPRCGNHKFWSQIQLENFSLKNKLRFLLIWRDVDKVEPFLFLSIRNLKPKLKLFSNSCQHFSIEFGPGVSKPGTSKISKSILCFKPKDLANVIEVGHGIFTAQIVSGRSDKSEGGPYKNRFWHGGGGSGQLKTVKFKVFYLAFFEI